MSGSPPWTLLPGEYLDQTTNTVWIELTRTEPCDEPGCYHAALYELDRTVVSGTTAKLAFRCTTHAPKFIVGTGQQFFQMKFDAADLVIPPVSHPVFECPECWNTGFFKGHGINCQRGCKPGKPVLPPATGGRIFLI